MNLSKYENLSKMKDEIKDYEEIQPLLPKEIRADVGGMIIDFLRSNNCETIEKSSSAQETRVYW